MVGRRDWSLHNSYVELAAFSIFGAVACALLSARIGTPSEYATLLSGFGGALIGAIVSAIVSFILAKQTASETLRRDEASRDAGEAAFPLRLMVKASLVLSEVVSVSRSINESLSEASDRNLTDQPLWRRVLPIIGLGERYSVEAAELAPLMAARSTIWSPASGAASNGRVPRTLVAIAALGYAFSHDNAPLQRHLLAQCAGHTAPRPHRRLGRYGDHRNDRCPRHRQGRRAARSGAEPDERPDLRDRRRAGRRAQGRNPAHDADPRHRLDPRVACRQRRRPGIRPRLAAAGEGELADRPARADGNAGARRCRASRISCCRSSR